MFRAQGVFNPDTRVEVNATHVFPYWSIGQLEMRFPGGDQYTGTGTLIATRYVLTCAHNLFDEKLGGAASEVKFFLARNGKAHSYANASAEKLFYPSNYLMQPPANPNVLDDLVEDHTAYLFDYGLIRLDRELKPGVLMEVYSAPDNMLRGRAVGLAGYPGDKPEGTMWNDGGPLCSPLDEHFLSYKISTCLGESGSAIRSSVNGSKDTAKIIGIHVAGSIALGANFAVRITDEIEGQVECWMHE